MDFLKIAVTAGISVFVLFIIARVIGYRQVSQISMFDKEDNYGKSYNPY